MRRLTYSLLAASCLTALPVLAEESASPHTVTGNVGIYSQYIFRGLTQTNEKPALQGGFDYGHASGFYAGIWGSNISWFTDTPGLQDNSASLELDLYLGYRRSFGPGFTFDVGYLRYEYPGEYLAGVVEPNTDELYGLIGWKWITLKYSHSLNDTFGVANSDGTYYLDLTAAIPLNDWLTLTLHAGRQEYKTNSAALDDAATYDDYKIELAGAFGTGWIAGVGGTDARIENEAAGFYVNRFNKNIGDSQGYVFIKKTF